MKTDPVRDLSIIGDFIKYTLICFVPFFIFGAIYGLVYKCYLLCLFINPLIYSAGMSLIIIVIIHDVNDILDLVGLGKEQQISSHIRYAKAIQEIAMLMSMTDYDPALRKVNALLKKDPHFSHALNLKGEILQEGFQKNEEARQCFDRVLKRTKPDDEQYKLAEVLKASTYSVEEDVN